MLSLPLEKRVGELSHIESIGFISEPAVQKMNPKMEPPHYFVTIKQLKWHIWLFFPQTERRSYPQGVDNLRESGGNWVYLGSQVLPSLTNALPCRVKLLRQHAGIPGDGHEVGVANPTWQSVHVDMAGDSSAARLA